VRIHGGPAELAGRLSDTGQDFPEIADDRRRGAAFAFARWTTAPIQPLSISHQSQFPPITISFNLASGASLGQATDAVRHAQNDLKLPATINNSFQGNAQAFQDSL
jgi:HAE1 family hydrophobic/amphiphilic exporter-1